jgi:hypothetical protein
MTDGWLVFAYQITLLRSGEASGTLPSYLPVGLPGGEPGFSVRVVPAVRLIANISPKFSAYAHVVGGAGTAVVVGAATGAGTVVAATIDVDVEVDVVVDDGAEEGDVSTFDEEACPPLHPAAITPARTQTAHVPRRLMT